MISYFPHPYKDEVIYSIVARYHHNMGNTSRYQTMNELFSTINRSITTEYINDIEYLGYKIRHFTRLDKGMDLIENHTTAPLYYPFTKSNTKNPFEITSIYKFKKRSNEIKPKENLHYCVDCLNEQMEKHGEGYWNKWDQIPGVFVCVKHKKPLYKHPINIEKLNYNGFFLPDNDAIKQATTYQLIDIEKHIEIVKDIKYLFNLKACFLVHELYKKYLTVIKVQRIAYPMSQMKKNLSDLLQSTYSEDLLNLLNSNLQKYNWINNLFCEKKILNIHPVRHILLMRALSGSVQDFIENNELFEPFGKGPWICMNPLSNHNKERVVNNVEISIHSAKRIIQGDFSCSCGFVYRLREGENNPLTIPYFSNRVMKKGHVWEECFFYMVNNGWKIKDISEITQLSRVTIRKLIKEGVDPIQNAIRKREMQSMKWREKRTAAYRIVWENAVKSNPNFSRKELAKLNRAVYSWLHQYDSEWLEKNSPTSRKGFCKKEKEKFDLEDSILLIKAQEIINEWKSNEVIIGKPIRVSFNAIVTLLGKKQLFYESEKYPLTSSFINSIQESVQDFQIRKIEVALNTHFKDKLTSKNQLLEISGIRRSIKPEIVTYVDEIIDKHNCKYSKQNI
jgi:hypothetical protein